MCKFGQVYWWHQIKCSARFETSVPVAVQLSEIVMKVPKHSSSQVTPSSQHAAKTIDFIDMRKHASCVLIEVLCLCNARIADSSAGEAVTAEARRQVEGLEVEVSDEVADALWAFAEGLLDEKCRLQALIADLEENSDPGTPSRSTGCAWFV